MDISKKERKRCDHDVKTKKRKMERGGGVERDGVMKEEGDKNKNR